MSTLESGSASIRLDSSKSNRRKWLRITLIVGALAAGVLLGSGVAIYRAARHVPSFYQQKLDLPHQELVVGGTELEQKVLNLHEDVQDDGLWQVIVSDDQINGWLAVDLHKKFPRLLPFGVREPRVAISDDEAYVACQYQTQHTSAVLSLNFDAFLTEEPNVVGFRIRTARIGAVPGLVGVAIDHITAAAKRSRIDLRWVQQDGDPVALVKIPQDLVEDGRELSLDHIQLRRGELLLAGRSQRADQAAADAGKALPTTARHSQSLPSVSRQL